MQPSENPRAVERRANKIMKRSRRASSFSIKAGPTAFILLSRPFWNISTTAILLLLRQVHVEVQTVCAFTFPLYSAYSSTTQTKISWLPLGATREVKNSESLSSVGSTESSDSDSNSNSKNGLEKDSSNRPLSNSKRKLLVRTKFKQAKALERKGQWRLACEIYEDILENVDPFDAHSHLGLARLQARRATTDSDARASFERGTQRCPTSVHLLQAWAVYEDTLGNIPKARELFERALVLDAYNPYVCHAYGLLEKKQQQRPTQTQQHRKSPQELWERALQKSSTAALVCSLGELFIEQKEYSKARELYNEHLPYMQLPKDRMEVYLALAWLEERYMYNAVEAQQLLQRALEEQPTSSLIHVALARLETREQQQKNHQAQNRQQQQEQQEVQTTDTTIPSKKDAKRIAIRRLADACRQMEQQQQKQRQPFNQHKKHNDNRDMLPVDCQDGGRLYNAWAHLEVQDRNFGQARKILAKGMEQYPRDPMLLQAAGKVEERVGNVTGARDLYGRSLSIEPTAPTLVAYALLELRMPTSETTNYSNYVKGLFEEALLLDPRHGAAYNAYGAAELRHGTAEEARRIFERGVRANCADAASIYHGYAKLELSLGNVDEARGKLQEGLKEAQLNDFGMDSQHRERAIFLSHTLGMMELNSNRPKQGLEVFTDGIDRFGNSSQLLMGAAQCQVKLGREDLARKLFERSVLVDPKHAQAWQAWGVMEMRAGDISTARKLFDCGIKSTPFHGALWQAYATMESRLGDFEKARSLFITGIKRAPKHVALYQGWASLELRQENFVAAKRLLAKALTLDKKNGSGWLLAAEIERRLGNDGLVGLILRRGIECAPNYAELYRALGDHLLHKKGDVAQAREILQQGMEVNPLHAPTYHSLAELEARVFNVAGLAQLNRKAAAIFSNTAVSSSTAQAWGAKVRAARSSGSGVPKAVAALAEKIVEDDTSLLDASDEDFEDPFAALESMSSSLLEDELVADLLPLGNNASGEVNDDVDIADVNEKS